MNTKRWIVAAIVVAMVATIGCSWSAKKKGTVTGAAVGGVVGGVIGKKAGNTAVGAILGAAVGGAAGAWIGSYMDRQAAEIERDIQGARVERVGEGIKITFDSGILFDVNRATLKPVAKANLRELAVILNKYPDTEILLEGHTDATGSEEWNLELSRLRAQAVANFLESQNVDARRFHIMGYGESQPIADNSTAQGRAQNRRVEVAIYANDRLKKVAKQKAGG